MPILLNSIALEPNRWTADKTPFYALEDLLEPCAGAGFHHLEVWQYHLTALRTDAFERLVEAAEARSIACPIVGLYPQFHLAGDAWLKEQRRLQRTVGYAARLGARRVKLFAGMRASGDLDADARRRSIAAARELVEWAHWHGMDVTAETHANTLCDSVPAAARFLEEVGSPHLGLCFQPYDFTDTPRAVADFEALHEHVRHIHFQGRKNDAMAFLEEADIDYPALFRAFGERGFQGDLSIEFVKDCVVDRPEQLDLDLVLGNAQRDRRFVEELAQGAGVGF
ncbi:MAG: sugar phosphate isomerase/epimerase [Rhodothermales bacterium]